MDALIVATDMFQFNEGDNRSGAETYGFDTIEWDLEYVSDRWRCQFRVQWIIDMLEQVQEANNDKG